MTVSSKNFKIQRKTAETNQYPAVLTTVQAPVEEALRARLLASTRFGTRAQDARTCPEPQICRTVSPLSARHENTTWDECEQPVACETLRGCAQVFKRCTSDSVSRTGSTLRTAVVFLPYSPNSRLQKNGQLLNKSIKSPSIVHAPILPWPRRWYPSPPRPSVPCCIQLMVQELCRHHTRTSSGAAPLHWAKKVGTECSYQTFE